MLEKKEIKYQFKRVLNKVKNNYNAEDILSDALLSFYSKKDFLNKLQSNKINAYFNSVVNSKIKDFYRKTKHKTISLYEVENYYCIDSADNLDIICLKQALTKQEHTVLVMRYLYSMTYKDIMSKLNLSANQLRNIINKIKIQIDKVKC